MEHNLSFFAFDKDVNGNIRMTDQKAAEAMEALINNLILLNLRFEEAFKTKVNMQDIDEDIK